MRIHPRKPQDGFAVIVILALLALLFGYVAYNAHTLQRLSQEMRIVEKRQVRRLQSSSAEMRVPAPSPATPSSQTVP